MKIIILEDLPEETVKKITQVNLMGEKYGKTFINTTNGKEFSIVSGENELNEIKERLDKIYYTLDCIYEKHKW